MDTLASKSSPVEKICRGIVIVSHDATRSGAPLIALNIARELVEARGIPVVTILLAPGELESEFARLGPIFIVPGQEPPSYHPERRSWARLVKRAIYITKSAWRDDDDRFWDRMSKYLANRQIQHAMCNTVLSGNAATRLKNAGVASIGLIHEMPHTIRTCGWANQAAALVQGAGALVFPCPQVQTAFTGAFSTADKQIFIYPQGPNINSDHLTAKNRFADRSAFRARLGLTNDDILILSCGGGNFRKGVDLFVQAAREMALSSTLATGRIVFAWAGEIDFGFRLWAEKDVVELGLSDRLLFLGPQQNMAPCFAAADIFFLPSREDPFPTVVLEAMASGLPVVGFAGSGGIEEQVRAGVGVVVPYGDVASAVNTLRQLAERSDERDRMGQLGRERIALSGGYHAYVGNLIGIWDHATLNSSTGMGAGRESSSASEGPRSKGRAER